MERPLCKCGCGEPMSWSKDRRLMNGGYWRCAVLLRANSRRWAARHPEEAARWGLENPERRKEIKARSGKKIYSARKEAGLCAKCGRQPLLSESRCWDCLNELEAYRAISL